MTNYPNVDWLLIVIGSACLVLSIISPVRLTNAVHINVRSWGKLALALVGMGMFCVGLWIALSSKGDFFGVERRWENDPTNVHGNADANIFANCYPDEAALSCMWKCVTEDKQSCASINIVSTEILVRENGIHYCKLVARQYATYNPAPQLSGGAVCIPSR